jgi:NAD(P)-dependent dehydrogenase (short-subunit alcohol dehydrogenase family)
VGQIREDRPAGPRFCGISDLAVANSPLDANAGFREGKVMREFVGKAAFVTGGASGIGLALGRAFAEAGCKVMLADIEKDALDAAMASLSGIGPEIRGIVCDVADPVSVDSAAEATFSPSAKSTSCATTPGLVLGAASTISR